MNANNECRRLVLPVLVVVTVSVPLGSVEMIVEVMVFVRVVVLGLGVMVLITVGQTFLYAVKLMLTVLVEVLTFLTDFRPSDVLQS